MNLLSNALKFTSNGKIEINAKLIKKSSDMNHGNIPEFKNLVEKSQNGMIEVELKDSGVGIKDEDKSKLFKLFRYLHTT